MSEVIIKCSVNGVVKQGVYNGRPVNAMCGLIKCSTNECSLDYGKCELQCKTEKKK